MGAGAFMDGHPPARYSFEKATADNET